VERGKLVQNYRVIQKECKIVHAYFYRLGCTLGAQTGGEILLMHEHFENVNIIELSRFGQFRQLPRVNF
jgi:hypothetical protein